MRSRFRWHKFPVFPAKRMNGLMKTTLGVRLAVLFCALCRDAVCTCSPKNWRLDGRTCKSSSMKVRQQLDLSASLLQDSRRRLLVFAVEDIFQSELVKAFLEPGDYRPNARRMNMPWHCRRWSLCSLCGSCWCSSDTCSTSRCPKQRRHSCHAR